MKIIIEPYYKSKKVDYHIHIGQFYEQYFEPHKVIEVLKNNGLSGCWFSSTTTCFKVDDIKDEETVHKHIIDEVKEALDTAKKLNFDAKALYWVDLDRHKKYKDFTIEKAMKEADYSGIKIHTRFNIWDTNDEDICKIFDDVCEYAKTNDMPILIHCGVDDCDNPHRFEKWFSKYITVKFILAHLRPPEEVIKIMKENNNVWTDTAFASDEWIKMAEDAGFRDKILYGTDYPLNDKVYK